MKGISDDHIVGYSAVLNNNRVDILLDDASMTESKNTTISSSLSPEKKRTPRKKPIPTNSLSPLEQLEEQLGSGAKKSIRKTKPKDKQKN